MEIPICHHEAGQFSVQRCFALSTTTLRAALEGSRVREVVGQVAE